MRLTQYTAWAILSYCATILAAPLESGTNAVETTQRIDLPGAEQPEINSVLRTSQAAERGRPVRMPVGHAAPRGKQFAHHELKAPPRPSELEWELAHPAAWELELAPLEFKEGRHAAPRGRRVAPHRPHLVRSVEVVESVEAEEGVLSGALRAKKLPKLPKLLKIGRFPKVPKLGKGKFGKVHRVVEGTEEDEE